jgi:hypothetical protein
MEFNLCRSIEPKFAFDMKARIHYTTLTAWCALLLLLVFFGLSVYKNKFFPYVYFGIVSVIIFFAFIRMKSIINHVKILRINFFIAILNTALMISSFYIPNLMLECWNWIILLTFLNFSTLTFFLIQRKKNSLTRLSSLLFVVFALLFCIELIVKFASLITSFVGLSLLVLSFILWTIAIVTSKSN